GGLLRGRGLLRVLRLWGRVRTVGGRGLLGCRLGVDVQRVARRGVGGDGVGVVRVQRRSGGRSALFRGVRRRGRSVRVGGRGSRASVPTGRGGAASGSFSPLRRG